MSAGAKQKIPAVFMRGGNSKGVFFHERDLPFVLSQREALLLKIVGSAQTHDGVVDGVGGLDETTRKIAIIRPSQRNDSDIDFIFGLASADHPSIDWSGSCENIVAAVAAFAIQEGLVKPIASLPEQGLNKAISEHQLREQLVRIWQVNLGKRIDAYVPIVNGEVQEQMALTDDPASSLGIEIRLEFLYPGDEQWMADQSGFMDSKPTALLPNGKPQELVSVPSYGKFELSFINATNPTVFVRAEAFGLTGKESPDQINKNAKLLEKIEAVRAQAATAMGLANNTSHLFASQVSNLQMVLLAKPQSYQSGNGRAIQADDMDVLARFFVNGQLHHAETGSGAMALGIAAALPGTLANQIARTLPGIPTRIGHASGTLTVGAEVSQVGDRWVAEKVMLSKSARRIMSGWVYVP
jgi:2-methylaconitate cis-trans-isomerase PrpF